MLNEKTDLNGWIRDVTFNGTDSLGRKAVSSVRWVYATGNGYRATVTAGLVDGFYFSVHGPDGSLLTTATERCEYKTEAMTRAISDINKRVETIASLIS